MFLTIVVFYRKNEDGLGPGTIRRVGASREWAQEALRLVKEADEHLAAR
jgi:hypothetical protein